MKWSKKLVQNVSAKKTLQDYDEINQRPIEREIPHLWIG